MALFLVVLCLLCLTGMASEIKLMECDPPNLPAMGGFAPKNERYLPGDVIHYFCKIDTHIAGDFFRICQDNGEWSGRTPMCDTPMPFKFTDQTSDKDERSTSDLAVDGERETCSETAGGEKGEWVGNFSKSGTLLRLMMFVPTGNISYDVIVVKETGDEVLCISYKSTKVYYGWIYHTCPRSTFEDVAIKIRSHSLEPLKICEIEAYVLTSPKCDEPNIHIKNGHLILNRHTAILKCDKGFYESKDFTLDCVKEGHWDNKDIHCFQPNWEVNAKEPPTNFRGVYFEPIRA